ncbi:heat shock protein 70 family [Phaeosphaeriaceae sp. PMI808]|nr:heat shock protein 70 family [Phaeosphaeriaceae sp. PMI808]
MPSVNYGIGIDLGTARTCTSIFRDDKAEIIPHEGNSFMPSCVAFSETGRLIGSAAESQAILNPKNTITNVLRFIGRKFHDDSLQTMIKTLPFRVIEKNSQPAFVVRHQNKDLVLTPVEVIAMILGRARRDAEEYLGGQDKIVGAVITVPVYFGMDQCQAIRDAALIAKLKLLRLISAPILACLDYVISTKAEGNRNVLLIDIGAGFLNVALFEIEQDVVEVKTMAGDLLLGGEDFNSRLTNYLASTFKRISRLQLDDNTRALSRVRHACEKAKCELSSVNQTQIELEHLYQGEDLIWPITRSRFEEECRSLFCDSILPIERVLRDSRLEKSNVKEVVIVGGSSRIPKLVSLWSEFFDHLNLVKSLNPDEAVARGAGFQAAVLTGVIGVAPFTIGIETAGGINSTIPTKMRKSFPISIYEGEYARTKDNKFMGQFCIALSPTPRGVPQIEVEISVDANMGASVYAVEKLSGKNGQLTLTSRDAIPKEELWKMIQSAEKFDEADTIEELRIQAKNNLEEYIFTRLASYSLQPLMDQTAEGIRLAELYLRWLEDNPRAQESESRFLAYIDLFEQRGPSHVEQYSQNIHSPSINRSA